jgi:hypothetical protein
MSGLDDFFRQIDEMKAKQDAKVAALRDGTDLGDLKADYLAATYQRQRLTTGLRILTDTGVPELARAEKRAEIAQVDKSSPSSSAGSTPRASGSERSDAEGNMIGRKIKDRYDNHIRVGEVVEDLGTHWRVDWGPNCTKIRKDRVGQKPKKARAVVGRAGRRRADRAGWDVLVASGGDPTRRPGSALQRGVRPRLGPGPHR